jgi:hypothetical protein
MKTRPGAAAYNPPGAPSVGPSASIDVGITSLADLAAVTTTNLIAPAIRVWIMAADGTTQVWQLLASTAETVEGVVQRPNDFNALTNAKVWFHAAS